MRGRTPPSPAVCGLIALAAAGVGMIHAGPARAVERTVLPGYWESDEAFNVLLGGASHARKCLTREQVDAFVQAPSTSHYRCVYDQRHIADGKAEFHGRCFDHHGRAVLTHVQVLGAYAPETFRFDIRFDLKLSAGVGLPGTATIEAHRLSPDCPADLPPGR